MKKAPHILISEILVGVFLVILVCTTFTQVFSRYFLNYSIPWADELSRTSLVWLVFVGMVVCFARGQHAVVGVLLDRYAGISRQLALTVIDVLIFILFAVMLYGGVRLMILTSGQTTSGLGISRGFMYAAVPFGASVMLIEVTCRIYRRILSKEKDAKLS